MSHAAKSQTPGSLQTEVRTTATGTASPCIPWTELAVLLQVTQLMASPRCQSLLELAWTCNINARHRQHVPCQALQVSSPASPPAWRLPTPGNTLPSWGLCTRLAQSQFTTARCHFLAPKQSSRDTQPASLLHWPSPRAQLPGLKAISQLKGLHFFKSLL